MGGHGKVDNRLEARTDSGLTVILPQNEYAGQLQSLLLPLLPAGAVWRDPAEGLDGLRGKRLLFAVALDEGGCNLRCTDEPTALRLAIAELVDRLTAWQSPPPARRVLAIHASARATSNTLALWELVKEGLPETAEVRELCLQNGTLADCIGCSYTACMHFG